MFLGHFQLFRLIGGGQGVNDLVQIAVHDGIDLIQRQADPMVRNPALGEIVGADPLVAHTGAHLAAAHTGDLAVQPLLLLLIELGGQHPHTFLPVLELAALLLAGHHNSRGLVDQTDGGAGFVDVLAAVKKQQLTELKELVMALDPSAFVIVQEAHQVLGDGFARYSRDAL